MKAIRLFKVVLSLILVYNPNTIIFKLKSNFRMELTLSQIVLFLPSYNRRSIQVAPKNQTQFCNHLKFISLIRFWCFDCLKKFFDIFNNNFISRIYYFQLLSNTIYWTWIPKIDNVIKMENCVYLIVSKQNTTLWILKI